MRNDRSASRGLRYFLVASLGLHLLFLLGFEVDRLQVLPPAPASPLHAMLSSHGPHVGMPSPRIGGSYGRSPDPRPRVWTPEKRAKPHLAESEMPAPRAEAIPRHDISPGMNGDAAIADAGTQASLPSPSETMSADAVRQYVLLLVPEARRLKRYPPLAREHGWEGVVEVTVKLGRMQAQPATVVTRSSGFPILDEQALATIGRATRLVPVPASLRGKDVAIAVPVRFSLQD